MFAHYVNDYADQLLGAAYAGNEEVAREAGVQRMVEIQTWKDVDVKWCEMNQTNWNPVKKAESDEAPSKSQMPVCPLTPWNKTGRGLHVQECWVYRFPEPIWFIHVHCSSWTKGNFDSFWVFPIIDLWQIGPAGALSAAGPQLLGFSEGVPFVESLCSWSCELLDGRDALQDSF